MHVLNTPVEWQSLKRAGFWLMAVQMVKRHGLHEFVHKISKTSLPANLWGQKSPYTYLSMCWILLPSGSSRNSLVPEMDGEKLQHHGFTPFFLVRIIIFVLSGSLRCTVRTGTIHHWVYAYTVGLRYSRTPSLIFWQYHHLIAEIRPQ